MSAQEQIVERKIAELLRWEWTKRREKTLITSLFYAVLVSSFFLPAQGWLPTWLTPFSLLLLLFAAFSVYLFLSRPWRERDSRQTLWLVDQSLNLAARTLTAREILGRRERQAMELLVLEEAGEKLAGIDPRRLLARKYSWVVFITPPLLLFWFLAAWFDVGTQFERGFQVSGRSATARRLKEYSAATRERARAQALPETFKAAAALDKLAEKGLRGELNEKALGENLARTAGKVGETISQLANGPGMAPSRAPQDELSELRAEIDALKRALPMPQLGAGGRLQPELLGKLATLPHLSEEVESRFSKIDELDEKEFRDFLSQLDRGLTTQMDRLTLAEVERYLQELLQGMEGEPIASVPQTGKDAPGDAAEGERADVKGRAPGVEPGSGPGSEHSLSTYTARSPQLLKGQLGEGKSKSLALSIEPLPGKAKVPQEEAIARYRRQAEEDLATEKIPEGLKETIKKYFLSLGKPEEKK